MCRLKGAFTLIELLVVIAIIAILAAILFPVFTQAKAAAKQTANLSNLRQLSMGIQLYAQDREGYPLMSSPSAQVPRTRWPDHIFIYVKSMEMFRGPLAKPDMFTKAFAHNPAVRYGGYGFNYQYLGNSRSLTTNGGAPYAATDTHISAPAETVAISDTQGVRRDNGTVGAGEYTIDPPLTSWLGSGKASGFYGEGAECGSGPNGCRSNPAEGPSGRVTIAWCDGHASTKTRPQMDDYDKNGVADNGLWNGWADASRN